MAISRSIVEDRKVPGTSMGPAGRGSITFGMDRPQTLDRLQNLFRDARPMPMPTPNPMPLPRPMPGPRGPMPMPLPTPPRNPRGPMMPAPGMGPFRQQPFPDQMPRGRQGIMEAAAVDPSDFRTIQKLLDAGLDPNDYIQAASMAYDDDDYGPFIPPSVIELDRFGTDYGPQDEYLFDRERGFENRIFGIEPDYTKMSGIMSALPQETQMAELTQGQKDFIRGQGGDQFQSRESLMNKIMTPQGGFDRGPFMGIFGGAQEPTTREELDAFLNSGMVG